MGEVESIKGWQIQLNLILELADLGYRMRTDIARYMVNEVDISSFINTEITEKIQVWSIG